MNPRPEIERRIETYLNAVDRHLAGRDPAARKEMLEALRGHIRDALRQKAGESPARADIEAVLADMDDPATFAADGAPPSPAPPLATPARAGAGRWFLLALAFLAVNAWGVWKLAALRTSNAAASHVAEFSAEEDAGVKDREPLTWVFSADMVADNAAQANETLRFAPPVEGTFEWASRRKLMFTPASPWPPCRLMEASLKDGMCDAQGRAVSGDRMFRFQTPPLNLESLEQADLNAQRCAVLRLIFNAPPDRTALAKHLRLSTPSQRSVGYELLGLAGENAVLIRTEPVAHDRITLVIEPGLPPRSGTLGLQERAERELELVGTLQLQKLEPRCPGFGEPCIEASFTTALDVPAAPAYIDISPAIAFTVDPLSDWRGGGCVLRGPFEPGRVYTVRFRAGLKSANQTELLRDAVRTVQIPNRPSSLAFATTGRYLAPGGRHRIPVSAVNIRQCEVSATPILAHNLVFFALRDCSRLSGCYRDDVASSASNLTGRRFSQTNALPDKPNQEVKFAVDLRELLGAEPTGAYLLTADAERSSTAHQLVVVTDLGLSARVAGDEVLVWVTSLRGATPVAGAEVVLYADNNSELARGTTDTNGLIALPITRSADDISPFVVTARLGTDLSFLQLEKTRVDYGNANVGAREYLAEAYEAYVFTDRGVYRPGETVHVQALVRDSRQQCPPAFPVLFRAIRPDGQVFKDFAVGLDDYGASETNFALPDFLPTGTYSIQLALPGSLTVLGQAEVAMEDFVPPQIRVGVEAAPARGSAEEFPLTVKAEHLFGRPAAGLKVSARAIFEPAPFAPKEWAEYSFGDNERAFSPIIRELGQSKLSEAGLSGFKVSPVASWRPPACVKATLSATVIESSGRPVSAYVVRPLDIYPLYIGLRTDGGMMQGTIGAPSRITAVAVQPGGEAVTSAVPLQVRASRITWTSALKRNANGSYAYVSEKILTTIREGQVSASGQPAAFEFTPESAGEYLVRMEDPFTGAASSLHIFVRAPGQAWADWNREDPDVVRIEPDKKVYAPGETARLMLRAPFKGLALLTVESDRIHTRRLLQMEGNTAEVAVPISEGYAPNVYCTVSLLRPAVAESVWTAHRAAGAVSLAVEPPDRRLAVTVEAPATNRPQSRLSARIIVRDAQGRPAAGRVTVMAVDEAICMLSNFKTPDPMAYFLAPRRMGVELFDLYGELMPLIEDAAAGRFHAPGDAGASLMRRLNPIKANRFKPVALWAAQLRTDNNGVAEVALDVPEFTGELRVMAVAYNRDQAGSSAEPVKIKRPLVVQAALPRFLAPGDKAVARVEIFNETGAAVVAHLRATGGGPLAIEPAESSLPIAAGASEAARLTLQAGELPGKALVSIEVEAGGERYADTIELAVRPAAAAVIVSEFGAVKAGGRAEIQAPTNLLASSLHQELWCSGRPAIQLGRALEHLMQYPYGCLEQTVSSAFPLLYLADLAGEILPKSITRDDVATFVQPAILRVLSMQDRGGFTLWPHMNEVYPWGSIYATHFLVEADKAGYAVPRDRLNAALDCLRERLDEPIVPEADPDNGAWQADMEERAYACHGLALAGRPEHGWAARLQEESKALRFSAQVHTAAALMLGGDPRQATALMTRLGLPLPGAQRETSRTLNSPVRDAALLLSAWLDVDPQNPVVPQLVARISAQQKDGHWQTTQDNAAALLALGKYAQRVPASAEPLAARLMLPGGAAREFNATQDVHWAADQGSAGTARIENDGPGTVYYACRYEGVPRDGRVEEGDWGLKVRREWLDPQGQPLSGQIVAQGDLLVCRLTLDTQGRTLDNLVIEELLPAGFEIENQNLAVSQTVPWIKEKSDWCIHREQRDDRLILFTGAVTGARSFYYALRAVTPGTYVYPALTASCMYEPETRSVRGRTTVKVGE